MNIIENFLLKAKVNGTEKDKEDLLKRISVVENSLSEAEMALLKAESDNIEMAKALADMTALKNKYQAALVDIIAVMERHGLVV